MGGKTYITTHHVFASLMAELKWFKLKKRTICGWCNPNIGRIGALKTVKVVWKKRITITAFEYFCDM